MDEAFFISTRPGNDRKSHVYDRLGSQNAVGYDSEIVGESSRSDGRTGHRDRKKRFLEAELVKEVDVPSPETGTSRLCRAPDVVDELDVEQWRRLARWTAREAHGEAVHHIKVKVYEKALARLKAAGLGENRATVSDAPLERVIVLLMRSYRTLASPFKVKKKWMDYISLYPHLVALRVEYLNFCQSEAGESYFDEIQAVYRETITKLLEKSRQGSHDEIVIYLILRFCHMLDGMGYKEWARAQLWGTVWFNLSERSWAQGTSEERVRQFGEAWEAGPQIETGLDLVSAAPAPTTAPEFDRWYKAEHSGPVPNDPFSIVDFDEDIRPMLVPLSKSSRSAVISAWMRFYRLGTAWSDDAFLPGPCHHQDLDLLYTCHSFGLAEPSRPRPLDYVTEKEVTWLNRCLSILQQEPHLSQCRPLQLFTILCASRLSIQSGVQICKRALKDERDNLWLCDALARLLMSQDKVDKAGAVYFASAQAALGQDSQDLDQLLISWWAFERTDRVLAAIKSSIESKKSPTRSESVVSLQLRLIYLAEVKRDRTSAVEACEIALTDSLAKDKVHDLLLELKSNSLIYQHSREYHDDLIQILREHPAYVPLQQKACRLTGITQIYSSAGPWYEALLRDTDPDDIPSSLWLRLINHSPKTKQIKLWESGLQSIQTEHSEAFWLAFLASDPVKARERIFRAMAACPWSKALHQSSFAVMGMTKTELESVYCQMVDRGMRLYHGIEE